MAIVLSAIALIVLLTPTVMLSQQTVGRTYHDTYYIVSRSPAYLTLAVSYVLIAGLSALIARLSPSNATRLPVIAFWFFYLGSPVAVFPQIALAALRPMPRRYAEYPDAFALWNQLAAVGAMAVWLAVLLLLGALTLALVRSRRR